ncbi:MAG: threonine synthase, partial [bacterium]|nr:threonine synthase [bacterium]
MQYISTRGNSEPADGVGIGTCRRSEFKEILLEGLAPDGGLYVPESYPKFTDSELNALRDKSYHDVALAVLRRFITDIPEKDLKNLIACTYTKDVFGTDEITPVKDLENGLDLLQLSNG